MPLQLQIFITLPQHPRTELEKMSYMVEILWKQILLYLKDKQALLSIQAAPIPTHRPPAANIHQKINTSFKSQVSWSVFSIILRILSQQIGLISHPTEELQDALVQASLVWQTGVHTRFICTSSTVHRSSSQQRKEAK